ncbi:hypothetical protein Tco_0955585 [Tanacetum coccineum]|uniref:Uncharacterized protein n=1 Tax=Tanacetum coccineum TaxID=301880 RepID=A0ABQ5E7M2_9ASTR
MDNKRAITIELSRSRVIVSWDAQDLTKNMSYLIDYEAIDGGYVNFEGNPKGGKFTGKVKKSVKLMMEKLFGMELELICKTINGEVQLHALVDGKKIIVTESTVRRDLQLEDAEGIDCLPNSTIFEELTRMGKPKRKDTQVPQPSGPTNIVANEVVHKELGGSLVRAATTASSLEAEQDRGNINKTQSKATPNEAGSLGTSSGGGPRRQETMGILLLKLVLDLETTKTTQANEIASLKRRVKKLERRNKLRTHGLKRLYRVGSSRRVESSEDECLGEEDASKQGRIADIDADAGINLVSTHFDADIDMFGVHDLVGDEVVVESEVVVNVKETRSAVGENISAAITVSAASVILTITTTNELTLAQALAELKSARPPTQGISFREPSKATTTTTTITITAAPKPPQDKGKGIMIEEHVVEKEKPIKKQEQMRINEELTFKLQAKEEEEEEEEERLAREKAQQVEEANIAWDDIQGLD